MSNPRPYVADPRIGDNFSSIVGKMIATTYNNCPYINVRDFSKGHFRGLRLFSVVGLDSKDVLFDGGPDGTGTKPELIDAIKAHRYAAADLLAMTAGDITRTGGLPGIFLNILDVQSLGKPDSDKFNLFVGMLEGLVEVANKQGIVVYKGETAEIGNCVGTTNPNPNAPFNWAGVALGIHLEDKIILGDRVRPGDIVIALKEEGLRCNGLSYARQALGDHHGPDYLTLEEAREDIIAATRPSALYDRFLATANGWFEPDLRPLLDIRLISHITGGGINKFIEALAPTGLSARLDDLYELPMIMRKCATWLNMTSKELYGVWNGGQGVILVISPNDVFEFISIAKEFDIDARICGEIFDSKTGKTSVELFSKYDNEKIILTA